MDLPEVRFAHGDGVRIAYQEFGSGPRVLWIPALVSNLDVIWDHEVYRRVLELARNHFHNVVFDKRGMGLSDRFDRAPTLEERIDDILTVMDAVGWQSATLSGTSEGGLMAQQFAIRHPERVERLVLVNTAAPSTLHRRIRELGGSVHRPWRDVMADWESISSMWGEDARPFVRLVSPSRVDDDAFVRWINRLCRLAATPGGFRRQLQSIVDLDTSVLQLERITAPTLVIHVHGDRSLGVGHGRVLAQSIDGAEYVEVDGSDHFWPTLDNWRDVMDPQIRFVSGASPSSSTRREFATVLFTDIVGSTDLVRARGDQAWRATIESHDRLTHRSIAQHGGRVVKSTGDGVLATFPIPSAAAAAARSLRADMAALDLRIRAGLHAGEIEVHENADISGLAVNATARVVQLAADGSIFVSNTVREMLLGGEFQCADRGEYELTGFDGPWHLYELL
jgi:class 3 adenylate cyclase/pimeloyl-ACP methyl ester carboxylesterase